MKQLVAVCIMTVALYGTATVSWGQDLKEHGALTSVLVQQIKTIINADSVLGKPLDFAGTKIVPIVSMAFGFGAGTGMQEKTMEADHAGRKAESGTGGGGGGLVTPQGLLVITPDGTVKVIEAHRGVVSEIIQGLTPVLLEAIKAQQGGEKGAESAGSPATP